MALKSQLESLLFISAKPMSVKALSKVLSVDVRDLEASLSDLEQEYKNLARGFQIARIGDDVQFTTIAENANLVESLLKEEISGELTRPSLEALTIIAYRGPITKPELEMIRGVNCSLILRNLLIRGLVEEKIDPKIKLNKYSITFDFLRFLGLSKPSELPEYEKLSSNEILEKWLQGTQPQGTQPPPQK